VGRFRDWRILYRIMSIWAITLMLMLRTILFYFLPALERKLVDSKKQELKNIAETRVNLVSEYDPRVKTSEFAPDEAQRRAAKRTAHLRYGKQAYLWISDIEVLSGVTGLSDIAARSNAAVTELRTRSSQHATFGTARG